MVAHISKWKMLNEQPKKPPGRPKKSVEDKKMRLTVMLDYEQYLYLTRRSKINYTTPSDEIRVIVDHEMENYPDELVISYRREVIGQWQAQLDNIEKIYMEDKEHRILIARSMMSAFLENNAHMEPMKDIFIHGHLENVEKRTGLDPNTIETIFLEIRKMYKVDKKVAQK